MVFITPSNCYSMSFSLDVVISTVVGVIAILIAVLTWIEGRKSRKLIETFVKSIPYTSRKKKPTAVNARKPKESQIASKVKFDEIERMKLELQKEKLQWQRNKDIARGIAWVIDHLDVDNDDDEYE